MIDTLAEAPRPQKRDFILREAARLFNEQGFHDTRLEDIAQKLGAKKTNISYYFKTKEKLLEENYHRACEFSEAELKLAANEKHGLDRAISFVRSHLYAHANAIAGESPPLALMADLASIDAPEFDTIHLRYKTCVEGLKQFLDEGVDDRSVGVRSTEAATFFAFNIMHWIPRWLSAVPEAHRDTGIEGFCDLLRFGLVRKRDRLMARPISRPNDSGPFHIFDRQARNELKKEAFLRTGIRHLNRTGFRNLSLDDLARELGVTRGAFYYQIADKDALLTESFDRTCEQIESALILGADGTDLSALDQLERAMRYLFEGHITELDPLLRPNLIHLLGVGPRAVVNARLRKIMAGIAELLAHGIVDGSVRPLNFEAAEYVVFGSVFAASRRRFAATQLEETWRPEDEPVTASAYYIEPLLYGLAAR